MNPDEAQLILNDDRHFLPLEPDDENYGIDGVYTSAEPKPEYRSIVLEAIEIDSSRPMSINQEMMMTCSVIKNIYNSKQLTEKLQNSS